MSYTFDQLKKRVGKNIKYYSDADGWISNRDLTETDIGELINEIYTEEVSFKILSNYPFLARQSAYVDSWIMSAEIASTSGTSLTIVTDEETAFGNIMVDLDIYNETKDDSVTIEEYDSTSTVTVSETVDDWDAGDTVYILGREFAFGGDASDLISIETVRVKYSEDDEYFTIADITEKTDIFVSGSETGSEAIPYAYRTTLTEQGLLYPAIGILPKMTEKVERAIEIDYVAKPPQLVNSTDEIIFPVHSAVIAGATMRAYELRQDQKMAAYWMAKFERRMNTDMSRFRPITSDTPKKIRVNRSYANIFRRDI